MSKKFANGAYAAALCDRCAFRYPLSKLKKLVIKDALTNLKVCPECWEASHPQLRIGEQKIDDPQALYEPRPDVGKKASTDAVNFDGQPVTSATGVVFDFPTWG